MTGHGMDGAPGPTPTVDSYVDHLISDAPPLSEAQRDRLRVLLRPASGQSGGAS